MKPPVAWVRLSPSLLLLFLAGTIAAAVDHFVSPADADRPARASDGYGNPAIRTAAAEYPRQAIDSDSFVVRIARPAHRIVSQYWSIDEYVYSVVPPERVIAVSESAYQQAISNVYPLVERFHPVIATDPERVLRLDPDLLMVSNSSRADFCAIVRAARVPIYRTFTMFTTLEQVAETIRLAGISDWRGSSGRHADRTVLGATSIVRRRGALQTRHVHESLGFGGTYSYGKETLFNNIVRTLGGINVGAEGGLKGYDQVNSEQIVRWNPEWIVAGAPKGQTRQVLARLMADPGIALTRAARNGHILVFEEHIFLPISPYTRLFVTALAEALYG